MALALAMLVATGCSRGCSCSPLARASDPRAFIPEDVAAVLEVDLESLGNEAIFRKIVLELWEKDSCLAPLALDSGRFLILGMPDTRPDVRTRPMGAFTMDGVEPAELLVCLSSELAPGAGEPEEETYRGVRHFGHPGAVDVRVAVVNDGLLLVSDRAGIQRMVDTFLDGMPSLAGSKKFDGARRMLPAGAQVRLMALPGSELRSAARSRFEKPWSDMLDAEMLAAGLVFRPEELTLSAASRLPVGAEELARGGNDTLSQIRHSKIMQLIGLSSVLADTRFDASGRELRLEARTSEKAVSRLVSGAGKIMELSL
jgi:hypothetical protein